ncbi:MAG: glutathione S-transferase [Gammaproteobacteria bacterium]|nr:glutathione S-transferase [Gammaproteobacteria bacterium]|tara:strand:+ start:29730 stop:30305 length:576 start_codon:yes stop_codon:yes gene_type:complete
MKLYGNSPSPFVRHCRIALLESGLDFEFIHDIDYQMSKKLSPTQKIPFLEYGEAGATKMLTDSTSILRYVREQAGQIFMPSVQELNDYCAVNTLIDAQVNLFLLKKEGFSSESVNYLQRQQNRIQTGLQEFEGHAFPEHAPWNDVVLRLGCFLGWIEFRKHLSLEPFPQLRALHERLKDYEPFKTTMPVDS